MYVYMKTVGGNYSIDPMCCILRMLNMLNQLCIKRSAPGFYRFTSSWETWVNQNVRMMDNLQL